MLKSNSTTTSSHQWWYIIITHRVRKNNYWKIIHFTSHTTCNALLASKYKVKQFQLLHNLWQYDKQVYSGDVSDTEPVLGTRSRLTLRIGYDSMFLFFIDSHLWASWVDDIYLYFEYDLQKRLDIDVNSIYASARVLLIMSWHLNLKAATVNAWQLIMMFCNYTVIFCTSNFSS